MKPSESAAMPSVAFLGAGAMGGAIIRGLLRASEKVTGDIRATGQWSHQLQELSTKSGVFTYDTDADLKQTSRP